MPLDLTLITYPGFAMARSIILPPGLDLQPNAHVEVDWALLMCVWLYHLLDMGRFVYTAIGHTTWMARPLVIALPLHPITLRVG